MPGPIKQAPTSCTSCAYLEMMPQGFITVPFCKIDDGIILEFFDPHKNSYSCRNYATAGTELPGALSIASDLNGAVSSSETTGALSCQDQ